MKVLSICGSPRAGNSEAILKRIQSLLEKKGVENEIILLREKNIGLCMGCVEYCNKNLKCCKRDDMEEILGKMREVDALVFASPNYFKMPPGMFKTFMDRSSVLYTAGESDKFGKKKTAVVCIGADEPRETDECLQNIVERYCKTIGMNVVWSKSYKGNGELKGNMNDIFESGNNPRIEKDLKELVEAIT